MTKNNTEEYGLVSYLTLRRVVGILGVALPLVVVLWGFSLCQCSQILPSISDYYDLRTRDVFVGILFVFAWFLFTYRGYVLAIIGKRIFLGFRRPATGHANLVFGVGSAEMDRSSG